MAKYRITPSSKAIIQLPISIGHKAEKGVEAIEFDLTAWVETYGSGTLTVIMRRWGDAIPYPIALEIDENNKATWTLSDTDTAKAGMAYAQLSYVVGDEVVKKSDIYTFRVMDSLTGEGEPPEAYESWLEHLTHLAAEAMAEVLDIEGVVTDKTLTVDGGIADGKATGDALSALEDQFSEETDQLKANLAGGSTPFVDMLDDTDTTNNGISYSLSGNTLSCDGTSTSASQFVWFGTTSSKPPYWFVGGGKYIVSIDSTTESVDVRFQIKRTSDTSLQPLAIYSQSGKYILDVPEDITVLRVVSMVSSGKTLNNDTLTLNIERLLNVESEISELRSGLGVLGIKNDLTWNNGSYKADGTISTTVQYGNRYCNIIDATTFKKLTITPFLGRQVCLAFFDRTTGAFVSRSDYTTESVTIDNTYSVGINLATTYTDRTISTEDLLSLVEIYRGIPLSKWTGRKVAFIGDSITHGSYAPIPYHAVLNNMIGFSDMYVDGVAGSAYSVTATGNYTPISQRWQNIPTDRDLVVIFAGTNDWGHDAPIGTPADTTDVSMCGALSVVINGVLTANPNARLVLITPLHRWGYTNSSYPNDTDNNGQGHPLADYVDAIKDMAQTYSIPVIDLFSDSGLNPRIPAISTAFFQDGLHPINAGHARLARQIASELEVLNFSGSGIKANLEAKYSQLSADLGDTQVVFNQNLASIRNAFPISTNLFNADDPNILVGKYITNTGASGSYEHINTSYFIPVEASTAYFIGSDQNNYPRFISEYDSTKTLIPNSGASEANITTTANTAYIRFSYWNDSTNWRMTKGSTKQPYEPYYYDYIKTDDTLTNEYLPANAKAVGEKIESLGFKIESLGFTEVECVADDALNLTWTEGSVDKGGSFHGGAHYHHSNHILVSEGDEIYTDGTYSLRFVCAYNSDGQAVSASGADSVIRYTVPSGITEVVVSLLTAYTGDIRHAYTANEFVASNGSYGYCRAEGDLSDGDTLALPVTNIDKNVRQVFTADITSFSSVLIGRKTGNNGYWAVIDDTNITVYRDNVASTPIPHGLTIENNLQIRIITKHDVSIPNELYNADITVISNGIDFTAQNIEWRRTYNTPIVQSIGSTLADCVMSWESGDVGKAIYMFGDSYFSWGSDRWVYYCVKDGFAENALFNAYPGENSAKAIMALRNVVPMGRPKYLVWCLGMNDGSDSESAPSSAWVTGRDAVINLCERYGITPVLATIPTVPTINHEQKNAWVRSSGYRYIDFAKAVGAQSDGTWFSGMLYVDGVHPTVQGAKALYGRVLTDFPEIMVNN